MPFHHVVDTTYYTESTIHLYIGIPAQHGLLQRHSRRWHGTEAIMRRHRRGPIHNTCMKPPYFLTEETAFIFLLYTYICMYTGTNLHAVIEEAEFVL